VVRNIAPYPLLERNAMGQKCYVLPEKLATLQAGIDILISGRKKGFACVLWFFGLDFDTFRVR
jgi:hypothetical protein